MNRRALRWIIKVGLSRRKLRGTTFHRWLGDYIMARELWTFQKSSVARGWFIGMLITTSPFFGLHTTGAVIASSLFKANIPVAFTLQFITNPFVAPFYYAFAFWLGNIILLNPVDQAMNWKELLAQGWLPMILGCTIMGLITAIPGYWGIMLLWKERKNETV
ncbi:MAG: DUF2062 domain-containing protein [Verrucomicrobiota bacterium]